MADALLMPPADPFADGPLGVPPASGWVPRPVESAALRGVTLRGGRAALVGRHGSGRRSLLEAALRQVSALGAHMLRVDVSRHTSWLTPAEVLATAVVDLDGGLESDLLPSESAVRMHRANFAAARVPDGAGGWRVELRRPHYIASARWPWLAFRGVLEEIARRAVQRRERVVVVLEHADALGEAPTGIPAAEESPGAELGALLDATVGDAAGEGLFTLLATAAPDASTLGALRDALASVIALDPLPDDAVAAWLAAACAKHEVEVAPAAADAFARATGGAAYRLPPLASACWASARAATPAGSGGETARLTAHMVQRVVDSAAAAQAHEYRVRWAGLPLTQRIVLLAIHAQDGRDLASNETTNVTGVAVSSRQRAAEALLAKHHLRRADDPTRPGRQHLRFVDPLFARWLAGAR